MHGDMESESNLLSVNGTCDLDQSSLETSIKP